VKLEQENVAPTPLWKSKKFE
jgi:hypothetical protein